MGGVLSHLAPTLAVVILQVHIGDFGLKTASFPMF